MGAYKEIEILPVGRGSSGAQHSYFLPMPEHAIVELQSFDHLTDKATGAFPENPIFRDQALDAHRYFEGWLTAPPRTHYGVMFHVSRLDDPYSQPPSGRLTWIYWVDYRVDWYTGLDP